MAEPGERFGRTYHYNGNGEWVDVDADGHIVSQTTLESITNGTMTMRGNTVFRTSPWRILWNIPLNRDAMITPTSSGRYLFSNETEAGYFNREVGPNTVYSATGSFMFTDMQDNQRYFDVSYMNITSSGDSLFINPDINGKGRFMDVPYELIGTSFVDELMARGYRPATEEEAIDRSAVAYLLRYYRKELEDILNESFEEYAAGGIKTVYQLAQEIAAIEANDFSMYISRIYDPSK